jgi:tetratricopeptide (TPR) repeat protein
VAYAVDGMVEAAPGSGGNVMEAERLFNRAKEASSNNPYVFGIWIQALTQAGAEWRSAIPKLLKEALWSDPDRTLDSPIRAPVAGAILMSQALAGFRHATERFESALKPGQISFLKYQESRKSLNPLAMPLSQVSTTLAGEDDALSRLLYAYTLKELGRSSEALTVMQALIPTLESNSEVKSSYPWSFTADLLWASGQIDESSRFYERALRRNRSDVSSVFGLAMVARAQGDYQAARQKLAETLALDPSFVPALLRQPRFEWHARLQSK